MRHRLPRLPLALLLLACQAPAVAQPDAADLAPIVDTVIGQADAAAARIDALGLLADPPEDQLAALTDQALAEIRETRRLVGDALRDGSGATFTERNVLAAARHRLTYHEAELLRRSAPQTPDPEATLRAAADLARGLRDAETPAARRLGALTLARVQADTGRPAAGLQLLAQHLAADPEADAVRRAYLTLLVDQEPERALAEIAEAALPQTEWLRAQALAAAGSPDAAAALRSEVVSAEAAPLQRLRLLASVEAAAGDDTLMPAAAHHQLATLARATGHIDEADLHLRIAEAEGAGLDLSERLHLANAALADADPGAAAVQLEHALRAMPEDGARAPVQLTLLQTYRRQHTTPPRSAEPAEPALALARQILQAPPSADHAREAFLLADQITSDGAPPAWLMDAYAAHHALVEADDYLRQSRDHKRAAIADTRAEADADAAADAEALARMALDQLNASNPNAELTGIADALKAALERYPDHALLNLAAGRIALHQNRADDALPALRRARIGFPDGTPRWWDATDALANSLRRLDQPDEAAHLLRVAETLHTRP